MRAIIIGAGRGSRLMPKTESAPKCFTEVSERRILDWIIEALREGGVTDICFIGGYHIDVVQRAYPEFTYRHNDAWADNNIMASLMYAEDLMDRPFLTSYSDILYRGDVARGLVESPDDIALGVDTDWLAHYGPRSHHPTSDAEKVTVRGGHVTRVHRDIDDAVAYGEFIGVARFSVAGAAALRAHYHRCRATYAGRPFREAAVFEKAYMIHMLQEMIEQGVPIGHVDTPGEYREIDTLEDLRNAETLWRR